MNYLLDTCVVSELTKKKPPPRVVQWLGETDEASLFLSVLTIGEIEKGIAKLSDQKKANKLRQWLDRELIRRFGPRIIPMNLQTMRAWGRLVGLHEKEGTPSPVIGALLAATALDHDMTLVTRNTKDLSRCRVRILDLWS